MLSRPGRRSATRRARPRVPSASDAWLLAEALLTLATVHLARLILPTVRVQTLLRRLGRRRDPGTHARRAAWAVDVAGRLLTDRACLTRALATQALLERRGRRAELAIGFRREPDGRLAGHAWIVEGGAGAAPRSREPVRPCGVPDGGAA